jgi:hypothetical protein
VKKPVSVDVELLSQARRVTRASDAETVRMALKALVTHAAYQRLSLLGGTESNAKDVPRRRIGASKRRLGALD